MTLFLRVLEADLARYIADGWSVAAEDYSPSVGRVYLLEKDEVEG